MSIEEEIHGGKRKPFIFNLTDKFVQNNINVFVYAYVDIFCVYIYLYASVVLYVSEMNDSDDSRNRQEELGVFSYHKDSQYLQIGMVLFESRLGLVVNVYQKLQGHYQNK